MCRTPRRDDLRRVVELVRERVVCVLCVGERSYKHGITCELHTAQQQRDKKRWIEGDGRIVRPGWFQGSRCCHLLSLPGLASCLIGHSQNKAVYMVDLRSSLRLWACARPQKRVNASVGLAGPLSHASTVLQAGILMSSF